MKIISLNNIIEKYPWKISLKTIIEKHSQYHKNIIKISFKISLFFMIAIIIFYDSYH